jgi:phosphate butyryltransferase
MPIRSFQQLLYEASWLGPQKVAIAAAAEAHLIDAARQAQDVGMAHCLLVGREADVRRVADEHGIDISDMTLLDIADPEQAAYQVMAMARRGEVDVVMKGTLATVAFMRAALDREHGLRTGRLFTHVAVFEIPSFGRLLLITDGGVVVAPDLYQKIEIVQNGIDVAHKLGIEMPRVAVLAASEFVNPKIPTTIDAANLSKMAERGQIRGGIVDGPLALDNAISASSAYAKGINSPVGGEADILVVPDVEAGNLLAKAITYFGGAEMAGVVVGGCAPIVVTSRSDSPTTKLVSIALGILLVGGGCSPMRAAGAQSEV